MVRLDLVGLQFGGDPSERDHVSALGELERERSLLLDQQDAEAAAIELGRRLKCRATFRDAADLNRRGLGILLVEQKAPLALKLAKARLRDHARRIAAELQANEIKVAP